MEDFSYGKLNLIIDCTNFNFKNKIDVNYGLFDSIVMIIDDLDENQSNFVE